MNKEKITKEEMQDYLSLFTNANTSMKRNCRKCGKLRNHAGKSSNVWFCNDCKPVNKWIKNN